MVGWTGIVTRDVASRGAVLVVDDDQIIAELLSIMLGREGFEVLTAVDGVSAMEALGDRTDILVAVCDLELGSESGVDVLGRLRGLSPTTHGIVISGHSESVVQAAVGDASILTLQKPFRPSELVEAVIGLC